MKPLTTWALCLLSIGILIGTSSAEIDPNVLSQNIRTLLNITQNFSPNLKMALSLWDGFRILINIPYAEEKVSMGAQITELASKVDQISQDVKFYHNDISSSLTETGKEIALREKMTKFIDSVKKIEDIFQPYEPALGNVNLMPIKYKDYTNIISHDAMTSKLVEMIGWLNEPRIDYSNIFDSLRDPDLKIKLVCLSRSSVQQQIFRLYQIAQNTLVKGLLTLIFADHMDENKSQEEKDEGTNLAISNYFSLTKKLIDTVRKNIDGTSRDFWRCDPDNPKEATTYERFDRSFQKYLFNLKNLHPQDIIAHNDNFNCVDTCELIRRNPRRPYPPMERKYHFMHEDVLTNRCYGGFLSNCQTINEPGIELCKGKPSDVERYSYIKFGDKVYGSKTSCSAEPIKISRPEPEGIDYVTLPNRCSYCMCTCAPMGPFDGMDFNELKRLDVNRYIDLKPVIADEGHVVVGVRLRKVPETHTFHLQIKQAKILSDYHVSNPHWKNITSSYPLEPHKEGSVYMKKYEDYNTDFHKIEYNVTALHLGEVSATLDYQVVTGVKFETKSRGKEKDGKVYLGLEVKFSKFNSDSGEFYRGADEWKAETRKEFPLYREKISVDGLDLPIKFNKKNKQVTDGSTHSIEFANSGLEADVGQNVLPFIDIQDVESDPPVPLAGLGLYHRGFKDSGGYVGLKAITIDLKRYLPSTEFFESQQQEFLDSVKAARSTESTV